MNKFISIDFETAMFRPNSAIAIGMVKFYDYQPFDTFYSLIRPPHLYIRPDFTDIHGLTVDDVKNAPDFKQLWDAISGFWEGLPLAAHNASFDMGVLRATLEHYDIPMPKNKYFCSLALSRRIWPGLPSHSLSNLAGRFKISYQAHNALADATTCGKIIELCAQSISTEAGMDVPIPIKDVLRKMGLKMNGLS